MAVAPETLAEMVRNSPAMTLLADAIWRRIRQEILEALQEEILRALDGYHRVGDLANAACTMGTPGVEIVPSATVPFGTVSVPFRAVVTAIDVYTYPDGGITSSSVTKTAPGGGTSTLMPDSIIEAGSLLSYY